MLQTRCFIKQKKAGGADLAIQNAGGIRASIDAGDITLDEVLTVLPFANTLVTLELTGEEVIVALENGVSQIEQVAGRYPQVAGMKFSYEMSNPVGERVLDVRVQTENGFEPIELDEMYTVATNAYIAGGGDGYETFAKAKEEGRMNELFFVDYEVFNEYLQEMGPVTSKVEARIVESDLKRLAGEDRYETAVEVSKQGWESADTVIIARGDSFADALAGAPLAKKYNAPILLTDSNKLSSATKKEIERLGAKKVMILGGTSAVSKYVEYQLGGLGVDVARVQGADRYETAANIAAKLGGNPEKAIVVSGENFPDALSIASYAANMGYPILLTDDQMLPDSTKLALSDIDETIVVGGEKVVSKVVMKKLPSATRYAGDNRYETAAVVATELHPSYKVMLANGNGFADALTGSVLAAKENAVILLTEKEEFPTATFEALVELSATHVTILGGTAVISDELIKE